MPLWTACSQGLTILLVNNLFLTPKGNFPPSNSCPLSRCCAPCRGSAPPFACPLAGSYPGACKKMTDSSCPDLQGTQETAETSCGTQVQRICLVGKHSHCRTPISKHCPAIQTLVRTLLLWLYVSLARITSEHQLPWKTICLSACHLS